MPELAVPFGSGEGDGSCVLSPSSSRSTPSRRRSMRSIFFSLGTRESAESTGRSPWQDTYY